jgi:ribosomal protein L22
MNAQLEAGDLYVNSRGQFFLNRQPTNARDAAVAAMVISGNKQNTKLNDLMNKVNLNNTKIQMASTLSTATSVADLRTKLDAMKTQYGFSDVLSEITGGALSDANVTNDMDISGATGSFQSTLKTAINNATKNQDLDTQSLQQLTSQIQANNTAMTQLIQAFEQLMKSLAQNFG